MFKSLYILLIIVLFLTVFNGCLFKMNSDGTTALNKHVTISAPTDKSSLPTTNPDKRNSNFTEDGWGVNPNSNNLNENMSWYTKKFSGKANDRSIELKSPSYMEATCNESIKKQNRKALLESALASVAVNLQPETISDLSEKILKVEYNNFEAFDCKPISADGTFAECECSLSYKVVGGKQNLIEKMSSAK